MNAAERRVPDAIDYGAIYRFIAELIATPSYVEEKLNAQEFMAGKLSKFVIDVGKWEINSEGARKHPDLSMSYEHSEGLGVVGTARSDYGKNITLCWHIDIVAPGDTENWDIPSPNATIEDGILYGRGSTV